MISAVGAVFPSSLQPPALFLAIYQQKMIHMGGWDVLF